MDKKFSVAIDGPAGAGKSSLAKKAAKHFGFIYVDTGAIYRAVGYAAQLAGIDSKDAEGISKLLPTVNIEMEYDKNGEQIVLLNGTDVSRQIRTPKSSIYASDVSAMPEVRTFLLKMQRDMAEKNNVIMDGRDIGTVVLPNADIKIYLTADAEERARRRCLELEEKGTPSAYEKVLEDIKYRDHQDMNREIAPLKKADDAVLLDTTKLDLEGSFAALCSIISGRLGL